MFNLDGATLNFVVQDANNSNRRVVIPYAFDPLDAGLFHHFVGTVDVDATAGANLVGLYHNGAQVGNPLSASDILLDWSGSNGAGLGRGNGGLPMGTSGYTDFDGDVAVLRYYASEILSAGQIRDNYAVLAGIPEPTSVILLWIAMVCGGLVSLRCRRVRRWARHYARRFSLKRSTRYSFNVLRLNGGRQGGRARRHRAPRLSASEIVRKRRYDSRVFAWCEKKLRRRPKPPPVLQNSLSSKRFLRYRSRRPGVLQRLLKQVNIAPFRLAADT
jgi:hypothetical protein